MKLVWHRNDLRTLDNRALAEAGREAAPVWIADPEWFSHDLVSNAQKRFVLECVSDLEDQYRELGTELCVRVGDPIEALDGLEHEIYFNADMNRLDRHQERKAREKFESFETAAVTASGKSKDRGRRINEYFNSSMHKPPEPQNSLESTASLEEMKRRFIEGAGQKKFGEGGTEAGRRRLDAFLENIDEYAGSISAPAEAEQGTSHLSPYIRYGALSVREVYKRAEARKETAEKPWSVDMFLERLEWQQHFRQKIEDNPDLPEQAINPVYRDLHRENQDEELIEAWKSGRTGYPLVDASMRALVETGWLNFRMRAMCASFFSYILKQWWKTGADFFFRHLIDADVAINYYQWQMQSGLVGVHANRIYDPTKQVEENDPSGDFIRRYVPELGSVPGEFIAEPWKMPENVQREAACVVGEDYPRPVVNYEREARKAREFFKRMAPEAYAAFEDDEVWRKASLSDRHSREQILERSGRKQLSLGNFG